MRLFHAQNKTESLPGEIGGTPLFIIAGESNAGRCLVSEMTGGEAAIYAPPITNAKMFNAWRYFQDGITAFETLDAGVNTMLENRASNDEFGPEVSLAYNLEQYESKNRYYIKSATGGSYLYPGTGGYYPGDFRYSQMQTIISAALSDASALGITDLKLHGFIFIIGGNDATDSIYAAAHGSNLAYFFSQFHTWWTSTMGMNADYRKIILKTQLVGFTYEPEVRAAQVNYATTNNAILLDNEGAGYPIRGDLHISASGEIAFGIDIYNQVKDL